MVAPTPLALSARPLAIELRVTKTELGFVDLLNWLARHNARLLAERPDLPGVYDSGVVYERETTEVWCDYLSMLEQGHEDCDGLAAARAGELMARGHLAMGRRRQRRKDRGSAFPETSLIGDDDRRDAPLDSGRISKTIGD